MRIADNIKLLRQNRGLSRRELAEKIGGITTSCVSNWEDGRSAPRLKMVNRLAEIFEVKVDDLLNREFVLVVATDG